MGQTMNIMGWISLLVCFAIMGMGGAPIAEKFGPAWLVTVLTSISYVSLGLLTIATLIVGGLGIHHGYLTIMGRAPNMGGQVSPVVESLAGVPVVEEPEPENGL